MKLCIGRPCNALANFAPRLANNIVKIASHYGTAAQTINRLPLNKGFVSSVVNKYRKAVVRQYQIHIRTLK